MMEPAREFTHTSKTWKMLLAMDIVIGSKIKVTSPAFEDCGLIPARYTCDGENVNPPLLIGDLPRATRSLAITVECTNAPINAWSHWLIWNIPPAFQIKENRVPGIQGLNDFQQFEYCGPCPSIPGDHIYLFRVYALDRMLGNASVPRGRRFEQMLPGALLGKGELVGTYNK